ncbi:AlpA family transcriptional regulator [Salmonella enterica subsp. enterica]|nr:AlpA family transcriptional regulator [Salmonella enterica subsp. enterica]
MHTAFSSPSSAPAAPLMPVSDAVQERFIRLPEVIHLCGLSRSTIYDLISREAFPKQISLGGKNVAWAQSEITAWMAGVLPNATGVLTHDDNRSANSPFFWLASFRHFQV